MYMVSCDISTVIKEERLFSFQQYDTAFKNNERPCNKVIRSALVNASERNKCIALFFSTN